MRNAGVPIKVGAPASFFFLFFWGKGAGVLNKIGCSSAISSKLDCARLALFLQNAPTFWLLPKGNFSTHSKVERRRIDAKCPEYAAHSR